MEGMRCVYCIYTCLCLSLFLSSLLTNPFLSLYTCILIYRRDGLGRYSNGLASDINTHTHTHYDDGYDNNNIYGGKAGIFEGGDRGLVEPSSGLVAGTVGVLGEKMLMQENNQKGLAIGSKNLGLENSDNNSLANIGISNVGNIERDLSSATVTNRENINREREKAGLASISSSAIGADALGSPDNGSTNAALNWMDNTMEAIVNIGRNRAESFLVDPIAELQNAGTCIPISVSLCLSLPHTH